MLLRILQNVSKDFLVSFEQLIEPAPTAFIGRNGIVFDPSSAGVLIKVVARIGRLVDCVQIRTRPRLYCFIGLCRRRPCKHDTTHSDHIEIAYSHANLQCSWLFSEAAC